MIKTTVQSSNVDVVGWENETLFVRFKKGATYVAPEVPFDEYNALVSAPSVGIHYNSNIKSRFNVVPATAEQAARLQGDDALTT